MSALSNQLAAGFQGLIDRAGLQIRVRYFTSVIGSVYDDTVSLSQSGTDLWTSGIVQSIDEGRGSVDAILIEKGKLVDQDRKLFTAGSLTIIGSEFMTKIQVGSPIGDQYFPLADGMIAHEVEATPIYKKTFLRQIGGTGSYLGEA